MYRNAIEEGEELKRLRAEHEAASMRAGAILQAKGMDSPEFAEAERATGVLYCRIREIMGTANSHWMA